MSDKKNLDRLFQEKFKDFEVTPPEFVWENIQEALQEKKKRRVIPLWIKLSGVAAILVIGSLFTIPYFSGIDTNDNPVVIDKNGHKRIYPSDKTVPNHGTVVGDRDNIAPGANDAVASGKEVPTGSTDAITDPGNTTGGTVRSGNLPVNDAVAHEGNGSLGRDKKDGRRVRRNQSVPSDAVASQGGNSNRSGSNRTGSRPNAEQGSQPTQVLPENNREAVAQQNEKARQGSNGNENTPDKTSPENGIIKKDLPVAEAIAGTAVDTVKEPENELEKLRREMEEKKNGEIAMVENADKAKWNIKPQVAPVFYNSLSGGSPIDPQFASNSKSFDNDMSYGVGINYAVNDRLSIRSGINTVNLSYATNDVEFHASLSKQTSNVAARSSTANIVVTNGNDQSSNPQPTTLTIPVQSFNGSMIQKTGYIEVPVEMSYALINNKFGVDVIGGVSTLFLNENNVSVVSTQGYGTEVGRAQNLNNIHFSTNIGVGFKYRFWKQFQANFEPMFKYQVNAYSRDAGNFKPYFIGLYSGISFSF